MKHLKVLIFIFCLSIIACKRKDWGGPILVPNSIFFLVKVNNERLSDTVLNNLKLSYYQNGTKKYLSDFQRATNEGPFFARDSGIVATRNVGIISADENIKTYYLEYPSGDVDTLFIDYQHVDRKTGLASNCGCYYPLYLFKFNGVVQIVDTSFIYQTIYTVNK